MGIKDFEAIVAAVLPDVVALVPQEPAARLGRWEPKGHRPRGTRVQDALDEVGDLLAERLLGALELAVDRLTVDIPPDLVAGLEGPAVTRFGMVMAGGQQSATKQAVAIVEQVHPGATELVTQLVVALRDTASVADVTGDEAAIAARHGAAYLALAVVVATAVLRSLGTAVAGETAAIVGVALGVAAVVLPGVPKPAGYAAAVLAKRRAEYRLPQWSSVTAAVTGHRFHLSEGTTPANVDFGRNGLVAATEDGVAVRTGVADGQVRVGVRVLADPPADLELTGWDEVVEISWTAPAGGAVLSGTATGRDRWESPPWPGDYRVRVHATGRDDGEDSYQLIMWQAPAAPEIVHRKADRLGHRLRGEPEPPPVVHPDAEYRWIEKSPIQVAATVTVIRGLTTDEVITTFGGDPAAPEQLSTIAQRRGYVSVLTVLPVDGAVLAVEDNGFQGADRVTLTALSRNGKAASLYWNVNANYQLAFAEHEELLFAGDPRRDPGAPHVDDMDFDDHRHRLAKGLTALARFTGRGITPADLSAIYAADQAYVLL